MKTVKAKLIKDYSEQDLKVVIKQQQEKVFKDRML